VVGGFKGGELGVKQFVEVGDIKLAEKVSRQQSTLIVAGIVAAASTLGGLFLFQVRLMAASLGYSLGSGVQVNIP